MEADNKLPTVDDEGRTVHHCYRYYPPGVKQTLASGRSAWIGEVDDSTVFKYPLVPGGDMTRIDVERKLLEIIGLKGFSDTGIYLERAVNGTVLRSNSDWSGAERLRRPSHGSILDVFFTATSSPRIYFLTRGSTSSFPTSRGSNSRRTARCFLTGVAANLAGSTALETIPSMRTPKRTSLRWVAPSTYHDGPCCVP
jgi:hypothetical protein